VLPTDLGLAEVAVTAPGPGDVLVRNAAIGLNPVDWKVIAGAPGNWTPGHVPGVDGAGTVVALGDGVPTRLLGARVAYHHDLRRDGSFADYTAVAARAVMRLPDGLDVVTAAGFPCPGLTALTALDKIPVREGGRILLAGAGGAVGNYFVQLAVARGFSVTVLCGERHRDRLTALGASALVPGPLGPGEVWPEAAAGRFFAVVDAVGADHAARLVPALAANGHLVCIQGRLPEWPSEPFGRSISLHEVALGALHRFGDDEAWARLTAAGEAMLAEIAVGRLRPEQPVIDDFAALSRALEALRNRGFSGKPVIRVV
jgi:NADPH:quinone reductase-like Zn-dependent oxidoreductase